MTRNYPPGMTVHVSVDTKTVLITAYDGPWPYDYPPDGHDPLWLGYIELEPEELQLKGATNIVPVLELIHVRVARAYRRRGIATTLFEHALQFACDVLRVPLTS